MRGQNPLGDIPADTLVIPGLVLVDGGLCLGQEVVHVSGLNLPSEVSIAIFGRVAGDIFMADDAACLAGKVHRHIMRGSRTIL